MLQSRGNIFAAKNFDRKIFSLGPAEPLAVLTHSNPRDFSIQDMRKLAICWNPSKSMAGSFDVLIGRILICRCCIANGKGRDTSIREPSRHCIRDILSAVYAKRTVTFPVIDDC
jgi:hypothetical protein